MARVDSSRSAPASTANTAQAATRPGAAAHGADARRPGAVCRASGPLVSGPAG
jgi:hypothetical protein